MKAKNKTTLNNENTPEGGPHIEAASTITPASTAGASTENITWELPLLLPPNVIKEENEVAADLKSVRRRTKSAVVTKLSSAISLSENDSNAKDYVLDTNILLSTPDALFGFSDNNVWLTLTTEQELDNKKTAPGEVGFNARRVIRTLDELREKGDFRTGIKLENGGHLYIYMDTADGNMLPDEFAKNKPDNMILASIFGMQAKYQRKFTLVTNDIALRISATVCGIDVQSYKNEHIDAESFYKGIRTVEADDLLINTLYASGVIHAKEGGAFWNFHENEFIIFKSQSASALTVHKNKDIFLIKDKKMLSVTPKNAAQRFALYALLAPVEEIPLVILTGPAGCGKTFLSLAAGMAQVSIEGAASAVRKTKAKNEHYDKILITRNNVTSDDDFGYLPGDLDEKMAPLMAPFYDNLESLLRDKMGADTQMAIEDLFEVGTVGVCPLAYMRGRSITHSFLIVDEAQNATRTQIRDIVTRAGKGTKIVICGDPSQIDNHMLDKWSCGLTFLNERMKDSPLAASVYFDEKDSVRSDLASEGLARLTL